MGRVIPFSRFPAYFREIQKSPGFVAGTVLDTNIMISLTYDVKSDHEDISDFLISLQSNYDFRLFATVTTKAEFLDFQRRLIMTETLRDAIHSSILRLSERSKAAIQSVSGRLSQRERRGGDPVFNDSDLKEIKSAFSAGQASGKTGWLKLCDEFLSNRLPEAESLLADCGIEYVSQHDVSQSELFTRKIEWDDAVKISSKTCVGFSDAMILNAVQCSHFLFVVSADFDLGYAALASSETKDVVMPDEMVKRYRDFHF